MVSFVVFDIETIANENSAHYFLTKEYAAPGNYKDPAKIEAAIAEKRAKDIDQAALNWWTGAVVCIQASAGDEKFAGVDLDEKKLLLSFGEWLSKHYDKVLVGKSSKTFDVPFLVGRYMAHDLGVPTNLRTVDRFRVTDIDQIFGHSITSGQVSTLSNYAFGLGIKGKSASGNHVADMVNQYLLGDKTKLTELENYCRQDVAITEEVLRRFLKNFESDNSSTTKECTNDRTIPF